MTNGNHQKWYESKKFIAVMVFTAVWVVLIVLSLFQMKESPWYALTITSMGLSLGFIHVLYLGGQAAVDTFLQMALAVTGVFGGRKPESAGSVDKDPENKTDPQIEEPERTT